MTHDTHTHTHAPLTDLPRLRREEEVQELCADDKARQVFPTVVPILCARVSRS
jgi:hypothetical protein